MSRWRKLNHWMLDLDTFYHLYLLILLNAMYEGGVQLGCVVLGERPYIRSNGKIRGNLFFKVSIRPFCKRLESEKHEYENVFKFKPMKGFAFADYFYWMRISVKRDVRILGSTSLIIKLIPDCLRAAKSI
jgi:hypothetical protein